ncbi:MAG: SGNH/GDSL hydrolase family protein [Humidesulfovibrio sp.]
MLPEVRLNSLRICDGPNGSRDITVPKPNGVLRILCLGASTTGNSIEENGQFHSYPIHLEGILAERFPDKVVEVVNGGVGGRTSAEILVDYALNLIDIQPDMVVIYHAYNDLGPSLTPNFVSDYSHARKNLGETYHLFRWGAKFPSLPSALYTHLVESLFAGNIRYNLISAISRAEPDLSTSFQGTATYRRNLEHIIAISQARGIKVVLSSFSHFFYPGIENSAVHKKYAEGLALKNAATRELADAYGLPYADAVLLIPQDMENYVDFVHFTPQGMHRLATAIADEVVPLVNALQRDKAHKTSGATGNA